MSAATTNFGATLAAQGETLAAHNPQMVVSAGGALIGQGVSNVSNSVRRGARHIREHGIRGLCGHLEDEELEDMDDVEGTSRVFPLHLRMCVHSGRNILSSKGVPCGTRVKVTIGDGANAKEFHSERAMSSANPVWEFGVEHTMEFPAAGSPPLVQVTVTQSDGYGWAEDGMARLGLGHDLGGVEIKLPLRPPVWPTVQSLDLFHPVLDRVRQEHPDPDMRPKILVVWEVSDPEVHPPAGHHDHNRRINLMAVAEGSMTGGSERKQLVCVESRVRSLEISRPVDKGEGVKTRVEMAVVFRRDGNEVAGTRRESSDEDGEEQGRWEASPCEMVRAPTGPLSELGGGLVRYFWHDAREAEGNAGPAQSSRPPEDPAPQDGPTRSRSPRFVCTPGSPPPPCPAEDASTSIVLGDSEYTFWRPEHMELRERAAYLPGYHLRLRVIEEINSTDEGGESRLVEVGSWEERLDSLLRLCETDGVEWFTAILRKQDHGSRPVGQLQMSVDVFTDDRHQFPDRYDVGTNNKILSGFISSDHHQRDIYLTIYGDQFLFGESPWHARPVLKVLLGESVSEEFVIKPDNMYVSRGSGLIEFWLEDVHISAPRYERHARIQLWNRVKRGLGIEDVLVCEADIRELVPHNCMYWRHCYGGSVGSMFPYKCLLMSRNLIRPSVYRGTLAVHAASLPPDLERLKKRVDDEYLGVQLCVRLHRGLYIDSLRGKSVKVMVRLAGGRGFHEQGNNILLFRGRVDNDGVMRFRGTGGSGGEDRWWVQKRTPWIDVPPGVRYAYVHIVRDDQAKRPRSTIAGRFLLGPHEAKWKKLTHDQSLETPAPAPYFSSHFAGCLLGACWFEGGSTRGSTFHCSTFHGHDERRRTKFSLSRLRGAGSPWSPPGSPREGGVLAALCCTPGADADEATDDAAAEHEQRVAPETAAAPAEQRPASEEAADPVRPQDWGIFFCHVDLLAGRSLFPPGNCAALGLPPEEGALLQRRYRVRAESSQVDVDEEPDARLCQSRRLALPVRLLERAVQPREPESLYVEPPPPVLVEVSAVGQGGREAPFGLALVKHCGWWQHDLDHGLEPINLNTAHKAHWCMLDSDDAVEFNPDLSGGIPAVFRERPRVLLAALYSRLQDTSVPGQSLFETPKGIVGSCRPLSGAGLRQEAFTIEVDVLGLRSLHESLQASSHELRLAVASLWHGDGGGPGGKPLALKFKFNEAKIKHGARVPYRDCVAPVGARRRGADDDEEGAEVSEDEEKRVQRAVDILARNCHLFKKGPSPDLLGSSQELEFIALEIPYLQPLRARGSKGDKRLSLKSGLRPPHEPTESPQPAAATGPVVPAGPQTPFDWLGEERPDAFLGGGGGGERRPGRREPRGPPPAGHAADRAEALPPSFVLLPELLFRLQVRSQGGPPQHWDLSAFFPARRGVADHLPPGTGTLTVPLPLPVPDQHHYRHLHQLSDALINPRSPLVKAEARLRELQGPALPLTRWDVMRDAVEDLEDIAEMFVDVFAAEEGMVHLHPDLRVGRCLRQHCLFMVRRDDLAPDSEGANDDVSELRSRKISARTRMERDFGAVRSNSTFSSEADIEPDYNAISYSNSGTVNLSQPEILVVGSEDRNDIGEEEWALTSQGTKVQYFNAVAAILGLPDAEPLHILVTPTLLCSEVLNPHERHRSYSNFSDSHRSMLDSRSAWSVKSEQARGAWMQIDLGAVKRVTGLVVQGHGGTGRSERRWWVTKARVDVTAALPVHSLDLRRPRPQAHLPETSAVAQADHGWMTLGEFHCCRDEATQAQVVFHETVEARCIRVFPLEWEGEGPSMRVGVMLSQDHFDKPVGPSELFRDVIGDDLRLSELRQMTTKSMCSRMKERGYRSVTHLAAPQLGQKPVAREARSLDSNLHTFVRPVGHVITSQDRDSRFLCRLRMGLPVDYVKMAVAGADDADRLEEIHELEESNLNFLVVKFTKPGIVVWSAALPTRQAWRTAGEVLFAVQLNDGSGQVVLVRTPNFDIRYPNETSWVVRKTLTTRWRTLKDEQLNKSLRKKSANPFAAGASKLPRADEAGADRSRRARTSARGADEPPAVTPPPAGEAAGDEASTFARGIKLPEADPLDGYNRPIYVEKHAFVCRIRHREGGAYHTRRQTKNWWRAVLDSFGDLGQELNMHDVKCAPMPEDDIDKVRSTALRRIMNVDKPLPLLDAGLQGDDAAVIKGHIRMRRRPMGTASSEAACVVASAGVDDKGDEGTAEARIKAFCPVDNLWMRQSVRLSIYVLSIEGLEHLETGLLRQRKVRHPFLVVSADGQEQTFPKVEADMIHPAEGAGSVSFYQWCTMTMHLPGSSLLKLEVRDTDLLGRERLLGQTSIDLEDRWLLLAEVDLARGTTRTGITTEVVPPSEVQTPRPPLEQRWMTRPEMRKAVASKRWPWRDPDDTGNFDSNERNPLTIRPAMRPPARSPMEARTLTFDDPHTGIRKSFGTLRYIIDMLPGNVNPKPPDAMLKKFPFHITMKVWEVKGIGIFRDAWAERNDVKVRGTLVVDRLDGTREEHHRETQTHRWATKEANFNEMWTFALEAPVKAVFVDLRLVDVDVGGLREDLIYKREVLALDHAVGHSWRNTFRDVPLLGEYFQEVVFASWPPDLAEEPGRALWCVCSCFEMAFCCCSEDLVTSKGLISLCERLSQCCPRRCRRCWSRLVRRLAPALCCDRCRRRRPAAAASREREPPKPARLALSVEVKHADGTEPTTESVQFREPKGRINLQEAMSRPWSVFTRIIGPKNVRILLQLMCGLCCVFSLVLAALTISVIADAKSLYM